jgi:hypothetical protein
VVLSFNQPQITSKRGLAFGPGKLMVFSAAPPVQMGFDPADVKQYDPDLVIYEFVERTLHYRPDNSLLESELQAINKDPQDPGN